MLASEADGLIAGLIIYLIVLLGIAVGCGYGARSIMVGKGRSGASGFCLGFFLGLLGLLIAALLSPTPEHEFRKQQQLMSMMGAASGHQPYAAQPSAPTQAGQWATDPFGRHQLRYHDGARWTESVSDNGVTGFDPAEARPAPLAAAPVAAIPVAAGQWAPDPYRRHELRYFDGASWTSAVSNSGTSAYDPPG